MSDLATQVQNCARCPLGNGQKSTQDSSWHWCLLISQRSPAAIVFHGAQERLAGGSATQCLETETFQFQLRDRVSEGERRERERDRKEGGKNDEANALLILVSGDYLNIFLP